MPTPRAGRARLLLAGAVAAVVLALVVGALAWRDHRRDQEWAHGGDDVMVAAQVRAVTRADFPDALAVAGVRREPAPPNARQAFVVQVSWSGTPEPGGSYLFVLLDDRPSPPKPLGSSASWGSAGGSGPAWAGSFEELSEHYPWLARTAARHNPDGTYTDTTEGLLLPATAQGEGVLSFYLPRPELTTARPGDDLVLTMARTDDDGEVRWARRVPLSAP